MPPLVMYILLALAFNVALVLVYSLVTWALVPDDLKEISDALNDRSSGDNGDNPVQSVVASGHINNQRQNTWSSKEVERGRKIFCTHNSSWDVLGASGCSCATAHHCHRVSMLSVGIERKKRKKNINNHGNQKHLMTRYNRVTRVYLHKEVTITLFSSFSPIDELNIYYSTAPGSSIYTTNYTSTFIKSTSTTFWDHSYNWLHTFIGLRKVLT